jgi:HEAT repeats
MRLALFLCVLCVLPLTLLDGAEPRIATIEFFGHKGIDVAAVRAALPLHEGDELSGGAEVKARVRDAVVRASGSEPTDVATVCCTSDGGILLFIGLPGESYKPFAYDPAPTGHARVSTELEQLDEQLGEALAAAVQKGGDAARQDDSKGYALVKHPEARSLQLTLRRYALTHEPELLRVLTSSSDPSQRAIASQALGYARQSRRQLDALMRAARDPDEGVRNNVTRAMWVLARANNTIARQIQPDVFIEMLNSGSEQGHARTRTVDGEQESVGPGETEDHGARFVNRDDPMAREQPRVRRKDAAWTRSRHPRKAARGAGVERTA